MPADRWASTVSDAEFRARGRAQYRAPGFRKSAADSDRRTPGPRRASPEP